MTLVSSLSLSNLLIAKKFKGINLLIYMCTAWFFLFCSNTEIIFPDTGHVECWLISLSIIGHLIYRQLLTRFCYYPSSFCYTCAERNDYNVPLLKKRKTNCFRKSCLILENIVWSNQLSWDCLTDITGLISNRGSLVSFCFIICIC